MFKRSLLLGLTVFSLISCSVQKQIATSANTLFHDPVIENAHVGISIFEPATNQYWYNYNANKYFVPASNTKIPTCYVALKHLSDSLPAIQYAENDTAIFLIPTGDPTLLHPNFKFQPLIDLLKHTSKKIYINANNWKDEPWGAGWEWDDYNDEWDAERSPLPVYGNELKWIQTQTLEKLDGVNEQYVPSVFSEPEVDWDVTFDTNRNDSVFFVKRKRGANSYTIFEGNEKYVEQLVPFVTNGIESALGLIRDSIGKEILPIERIPGNTRFRTIYSQPIDSLLKPLMYHSDNFFAEQILMMTSNKLLGIMNDEKIIDTLLKTDFKDLPQKPRWADGSGLSHYNLFTPLDFVFILNKLKNEFGLQRIQSIFPTGGTGTLSSYYKKDSGYIYAKTGTVAGVITISGYLYTNKNKLLLFSVLVNNRTTDGSAIRHAVERFIQGVRDNY
ncbi:MAG: D-alanyl-D-alanine carboxypeptidase [Chitinophagaceae bacterium]